MKRGTFRLVIILAILSIVGISTIQVYWFGQAFNTESDNFHREVTSALHKVANRFFELNESAVPSNNPIRQLSSNYYAVMVNDEIDANLLEYLLKEEFEKRDLILDFEYGIYNCTSDEMVYGNYVSVSNELVEESSTLPKWENQAYYFGVNFPNRSSTLLNRLGIWIFSSSVLLLVIIFFAYALFVIIRQKRLSEIQKDFINTMTHEFKTPISTIAISAGVLKNPGIVNEPERLLNYATIIDNENSRMKKQVERVLQIATMDDSDIQLKLENIQIEELIEDVIRGMVTEKHDQPSIKIHFEGAIPLLSIDKLHISNVFYNLFDNAIKYCKGKPIVNVRIYNDSSNLRIDVIDNGIGLDSEQATKIFGRFYRVPTGNIHNVRGFGLGLNYVKLILEAHQGSIEVQSQLEAGSTFIITLPISN